MSDVFSAGLEQDERDIDAAITRRDRGAIEWIEGTLDLAAALVRARDRLGNTDFGAWLESRFGARAPKKDERAILVIWGRDLAQARALVEASETRSIRMIHRAFSVRNVANTECSFPDLLSAGITITHEVAVDRGEELARRKREREAQQEQREREQRARQARERDEREKRKRAEEAARATRMAEALERERAKFKVAEEQYAEFKKAPGFDPLDYVRDMLRTNNGFPLTVEEFRMIVRAAHPDNSASVEIRTQALAILNSKKEQLTGVK